MNKNTESFDKFNYEIQKNIIGENSEKVLKTIKKHSEEKNGKKDEDIER